jgi:hypothetical protein
MFLIEQFPDEPPEQVLAFLDSQVDQLYRIKIKLRFELGDKFRFQGREFVRVIGRSPEIYARLRKLASKGEGISRDYLHYGTRRHSGLQVWWLHRGKETEHEVSEAQRIT